MTHDLEIAELRRRLAQNRAFLRQLFELRWQLVNKSGGGSRDDHHTEQSLRINDETMMAVWRAVRLAQARLAILELIAAEDPAVKPGNLNLPRSGRAPRRRPPPRYQLGEDGFPWKYPGGRS